ncbi:hypothetical protein E3Q06_04133 [Wallemia mellicola]|nr:hypothetical protein E3Q21_04135 [Wallemia mellicola]TIB83475.1 hypothetical protein E3Q20_04116 [Wallemia mellicola]TIC31097.1 hypothetical protein E3Q09_04128 [Wallemia mellicola]TIC37748.1 hypothetical protein E3Q07_04145 [Wallemia mellicola]TIC44842.1 hypothetical protein E3Q06_04133 [Wallemia mellicola]
MNPNQVSDAQVQTNNQTLEVNIDNVSNNDSTFSSRATTINGEYFTPSDYETGQTNDNSPEVALENVDDNGVDGDRLISFRRAQGHQIQRAIDYVDRSHKEDLFSNVQLDLLLQNCINERISPYQKLTKKLNYGLSDIAKVNDFDAVIKRLKKRFIKNTGRAQYYNTRFGETPPFNLIEVEKLVKAFSKIEFVGAADHIKKRYIKVWSVFLSTSPEEKIWEKCTRNESSD